MAALSSALFPGRQPHRHGIYAKHVQEHRHWNPEQNTPHHENHRATNPSQQQDNSRKQKRNSSPEKCMRLRETDHLLAPRTLIAASCSVNTSQLGGVNNALAMWTFKRHGIREPLAPTVLPHRVVISRSRRRAAGNLRHSCEKKANGTGSRRAQFKSPGREKAGGVLSRCRYP